jgi:hypothetical protein
MVRANPAYLQLAGKTTDELYGHRVQDVFAVNPADPAAADRLEHVYRRVLASGRPHPMGVVRYDFPACDGDRFDQRYWSVTVVPVHGRADGGPGPVVTHVLQRAREVTRVHGDLLRALELLRADLGPDAERDEGLLDLEEASLRTQDLTAGLVAEVEQMRRAMASRAPIEQAKGVLMRDRECTAEQAFAELVQLSQHSNRKLVDVAAAVLGTTTADRG